MRVLGAILAGGQSRRFGSDKAEALLGTRSLIDHAAARLGPQVDSLVVCGRDMAGRLCRADHPRPGLGPLGGLAAALRVAGELGFDAVASAGCDTPLLPGDLVATFVAAGPPCYSDDQPIIGLWPTVLADRLAAFLTRDTRHSLYAWAALCGARGITLPAAIPNINDRADLAAVAARTMA